MIDYLSFKNKSAIKYGQISHHTEKRVCQQNVFASNWPARCGIRINLRLQITELGISNEHFEYIYEK